jgi:hypothetical protein
MSDDILGLSRRHLLVGAAAAATTGCYGSFNLTGLVYDWNGSFSSKWVRWLVFLGLLVIPVYAVMLFVDAFILNAIEFFSGEHPVQRAELADGTTLTFERTDSERTTRVRHERKGRTLAVLYCDRLGDGELQLRDERGRVLTRVLPCGDGAEARDGLGRVLVRLDEEHCRRVVQDARRQGSVARALETRVAAVRASRNGGASRRRGLL